MSLGYTAKIAPELRVFSTQLDSLQPHPQNAREHRLDKLMASLTKHGQYALIIAQKSSRTIVKGNGTWQAAKQLGWTSVAASIMELTDAEALAMLVDDNTTSDLARNNKQKMLAILKLVTQDTIWSEDDIADLDEELAPLVEVAPKSDAAFTHEFSDKGQEVQATRERKSQTEQERLKDVRFPLTLADHAVFMERLKLLQKRFGTPGAIATIMEATRRQAESEQAMPQTGRNMDESTRDGIKYSILTEVRQVLDSLPYDPMPRAQLNAVLERMMPTMKVAPLPDNAVLPGQLPLLDEPTLAETIAPVIAELVALTFGDMLESPPMTDSAGLPEQPDEPAGLEEGMGL